MKLKFLAAIGFAATLYSCDDSTTGIGDFIADTDEINAYSETYDVTTKTVSVADINKKIGINSNGVYSRTSTAYLGNFTDPSFGEFTADFITQINCPEGFEYPKTFEKIESTTLELYYRSYYGDSLAPMRVGVRFLNTAIEDNGKNPELYYTSFNPKNYYGENPLFAEKDYSAYDNSVPDSIRNHTDTNGNKTFYPNVIIDMDKPYEEYTTLSDYLTAQYKAGNFADAFTFINKVLKGFYVETTGGDGSVLYIEDIWLRTKYKYTVKGSKDQDSVVYANRSLAATKEIYMAANLESKKEAIDAFVNDKNNSYLKTPAGLWTEVTLPLEAMYQDLKNDTLNSVSLKFTKYKETVENQDKTYKMGTPKYLLLVREDDMKTFFEENKTFDNKTSFLGTYDSSTSTYSFSKLNRLISHIFSEMRNNSAKSANWDKLLLIPVQTETDAQGNIIGVSHDLEVNSARLFGGENADNKLKMQVIYTKPNE